MKISVKQLFFRVNNCILLALGLFSAAAIALFSTPALAAGEVSFASGAWNRAGVACFLVEGVSSLENFLQERAAYVLNAPEAENDSSDDEDDGEYANFAIAADISKYVNVREAATTESTIVGRMYKGSVAEVLEVAGETEDWLHITSGSVEGYISAQYFIYGEDAAEVIDQYTDRYAGVVANRLNVRKEPTTDSKRVGYLDNGEKVKVLEDLGDWLKVQYTSEKEGYVAVEFTSISEEYVTAKSMEEIRAEEAAQAALNRREHADENTTAENTTVVNYTPPNTDWSSVSELRQSIVDYAMQYLGNKYVHAGQSLETGTDCSGFTCYIYKDFGYTISRTPSGQYSGAGRSIDLSEAQPGDIICYSTQKGKCTHVGLYIGDNQIIHAANSRKGVIISNADYSNIIGVRNVID